MVPKAHHLSKVPLNWYKTVEQLFAVAFRQSTTAYKHASLCGWRPLSPGAQLHPLLSGKEDDPALSGMNDPGIVILETDTGISIEIDVPEIKEESLYIEVAGDTLIVRGECVKPLKAGLGNANNNQFLFERYILLPVEARPGQVQARLVGSIIRVIIKK